MAKQAGHNKQIWVYADWLDLGSLMFMGMLKTEQVRGKEIFSFSYGKGWLDKGPALLVLDPDLGLYGGPQYSRDDKPNFGLFLDSSPDRWGRVLMERREALTARQEARKPRALMESDYLLGVFDRYRMGGLRFRLAEGGPFLDDNDRAAAPPMTSLRTLEEASLQLENEDAPDSPQFSQWLNLLMSPGSSLGGARPKASVADPAGELWIAKFPSKNDSHDMGAWEMIINELAVRSGLNIAEGYARRFTQNHHTFLTKRFDRRGEDRIHFASAMTLLGYNDGADAMSGASYLHLAEFIMRNGAGPDADLEELWRRIVFNIYVSNSDDHLRNHGFLLTSKGWKLSPAFDINPVPLSAGLSLNISEHSNALDPDLARDVAEKFRIREKKREVIIDKIDKAVKHWRKIAEGMGIARNEIQRMEDAFLVG
ncbi:HipA domain-containing protein [Compostibacter hankyongensis]|uniref:HipA domain-containing protein n=1 Tax=Compostibacter hankyongensis TaxID=1007089 RepID=A0ABP8FG32_9BACT